MVTVEFFGIPRSRAGTQELVVQSGNLSDVLNQLAAQLPEFAQHCLEQHSDACRLSANYIANLDGQQFLRDPDAAIEDGSKLLILSADGGG